MCLAPVSAALLRRAALRTRAALLSLCRSASLPIAWLFVAKTPLFNLQEAMDAFRAKGHKRPKLKEKLDAVKLALAASS